MEEIKLSKSKSRSELLFGGAPLEPFFSNHGRLHVSSIVFGNDVQFHLSISGLFLFGIR